MRLTAREQMVLRLLSQGMSDKEIAAECEIGVGTVRTHTKHVFRKLGVHNRVQAARAVLMGHVVLPAPPLPEGPDVTGIARPSSGTSGVRASFDGWHVDPPLAS